mgnify:CR=1 FL=1
MNSRPLLLTATLLAGVVWSGGQSSPSQSMGAQVPVTFSGGFDTDGRDHGRPVALIAGALGVPDDVFRQAFSHVHPAPAGSRPSEEQARQNKDALLNALRPYGITNERLDEVSNYYRYNRSRGEFWPVSIPAAYALVNDGMVKKFVVTAGGAGFNSPPTIAVAGVSVSNSHSKVKLSFGPDLAKNGAVTSIEN